MDRLTELMHKKLRRESSSPLSPDSSTARDRLCWLCASPMRWRFRLVDVELCYSCIRLALWVYAFPVIDTPERRSNDMTVIARIRALKKDDSAAERRAQRECCDTVEVTSPLQANFVMAPSVMMRRTVFDGDPNNTNTNSSSNNNTDNNKNKNNNNNKNNNSSSSSSGVGNGGRRGCAFADTLQMSAKPAARSSEPYWTCARCTFINSGGTHLCSACLSYDSPMTACTYCGELCPMLSFSSNPAVPVYNEPRLSMCPQRGAIHLPWTCRCCGGLNMIDADSCGICFRPTEWACARCTVVQSGPRAPDGLRTCMTCRAYNTPLEALRPPPPPPPPPNKLTEANNNNNKNNNNDNDHHHHLQENENANENEEAEFGVNDPVTEMEKARQAELELANARLQERVLRIGTNGMSAQVPDGNCLFRALANQLFGTPDVHSLVRLLITCYMSQHSEDYSVLFDGEAEWRTYIRNMGTLGFWGDELCINAAARYFSVNIHVITSDEKRWHIVFQHKELCNSHSARFFSLIPSSNGNNGGGSSSGGGGGGGIDTSLSPDGLSLFLLYQAPVHYNDLTPPKGARRVVPLSGFLERRLRLQLEQCAKLPAVPLHRANTPQQCARRSSRTQTPLPPPPPSLPSRRRAFGASVLSPRLGTAAEMGEGLRSSDAKREAK